MKILIIENEIYNFTRLKRLLNDLDPSFQIEGPLMSNHEVTEYLKDQQPDLILADICLNDGLCFNALKTEHLSTPIIFTTAYDEYALRAFKYNSIDYLMKPIDAEELKTAIEKAKKFIPEESNTHMPELLDILQRHNFRFRERFLLSYQDGYKIVRVENISHIDTENKVTHLHLTNNASMVISMSLDDLEMELNPDLFFRASRQTIIHIDSIRHISNHFNGKLLLHLRNYPDTKLIVSKERASLLKKWMDR